MQQRRMVFVSYSKTDRRWLKRIQIHLRPIHETGELDLWDDTRLVAGDDWESEIKAAMGRSVACVLLLSADFLASEFVTKYELPSILLRAQRDGARVIPVFVGPCRIARDSQLARLQAINAPSRPLSGLPKADAEEVLVRVAEQVDAVLSEATPRSAHAGREDQAPCTGDELFEEIRSLMVGYSVLSVLAERNASRTISEVERVLGRAPRRLIVQAVDRFVAVGWIVKERADRRTGHGITAEGVRQLRRLAAGIGTPPHPSR